MLTKAIFILALTVATMAKSQDRGEYFGYSADNHRGMVSDFEVAREKFLNLKKKLVTKCQKMVIKAIFQLYGSFHSK